MRKRPSLLLFLVAALVLVAASLPVQVAVLFGHPINEMDAILAKLTPLNWAVIAACLAHAFVAFNASRWLLITAIPALLIVNLNNLAVGMAGINYNMNQAMFATGAFILLHGTLLHPSIRNLLEVPNRRWWLQAPRKIMKLNMSVRRLNGEVFMAHTHDISRGGAFIPFFSVEQYSRGNVSPPLVPNDLEHVELDFMIDEQPYTCQAKVVRKTGACGTYPAGIGLQFVNLSGKEQRELDRLIRNAPASPRQMEAAL